MRNAGSRRAAEGQLRKQGRRCKKSHQTQASTTEDELQCDPNEVVTEDLSAALAATYNSSSPGAFPDDGSGVEESMSVNSCQKRTLYPIFEASAEENTGEEEVGGDETQQHVEKKRRLSVEQVRSLEKHFEEENKLEPERKTQLARELGLQPRQVAVWFQNRRARWKTKQLEKDFDVLKSSLNALKSDYKNLVDEKAKLENEVNRLNELLNPKPLKVILKIEQPQQQQQTMMEIEAAYKKDHQNSSDSDDSEIVEAIPTTIIGDAVIAAVGSSSSTSLSSSSSSSSSTDVVMEGNCFFQMMMPIKQEEDMGIMGMGMSMSMGVSMGIGIHEEAGYLALEDQGSSIWWDWP